MHANKPKKAQGSVEYLLIIATVVIVASVAVVISSSSFGANKDIGQFNECKAAASICKNALLLNSSAQCSACDTACMDPSTNLAISPSAVSCCKTGKSEDIYRDFSGTCPFPGIDLKVAGVILSPPLPDLDILVTVPVSNVGLAAAPAFNVTIQYKNASDPDSAYAAAVTHETAWPGKKQVAGLTVSDSKTIVFNWSIPDYYAGQPSEQFDVRATVDIEGRVNESDETNNAAVSRTTDLGIDLYARNIYAGRTGVSPFYFEYYRTIVTVNTTRPIMGAYTVALYVKNVTDPDSKYVLVGTTSTVNGFCEAVCFEILGNLPPVGVTQYYAKAIIDSTSVIAETNETNNQFIKLIDVYR